jgi:hypothetical protein
MLSVKEDAKSGGLKLKYTQRVSSHRIWRPFVSVKRRLRERPSPNVAWAVKIQRFFILNPAKVLPRRISPKCSLSRSSQLRPVIPT